MKKIRMGVGSGYWGGLIEPAIEIVEKGDINYLGLEYLAEVTLIILHKARAKDPSKGYILEAVDYLHKVLPTCARKGIKIITNMGGANPLAAADEVIRVARDLGLQGMKVGVVLGDDLLDRLDDFLERGLRFPNLDTGEEDIGRVRERLVAANAYIGSDSMVDALRAGADIIITGRSTDNALYVAPPIYEFGWDWPNGDWDRVGAAITVGHIVECAECVTGGICGLWKEVPEPWRIGHPIAEIYEDGTAIITKTPGSGGLLNTWTVKHHLVYEVHDPANYLMPDGIADFTSLKLEDIGPNQVRVTGMKGKPRPATLKVCMGYEDGYIGEAECTVSWPEALEKARWVERFLRERFKVIGLQAEEIRFDYIGLNSLHGPNAPLPQEEPNEVRVRVAVRTRTRAEALKVRREIPILMGAGPVGTTGVYDPPQPRAVWSLWPTLIPRQEVPTQLIMKEVS